MFFGAGVQCQTDAWSDFSTVGPAGRQDHTMVWDPESQSALLFAGHASGAFLFFSDLWRYSWLSRDWAEINALGGPSSRSGHTAVWDAASHSMLVFGGQHNGFYGDLWQFRAQLMSWELLTQARMARAYHSAAWDQAGRAMYVFGGENIGVLADLDRYSLAENVWWTSTASGPGARSRHTAIWDSVTRLAICSETLIWQRVLFLLLRYLSAISCA